MVNLPGYEIKNQIFKSLNSTIYRGVDNSDNKWVIIKVINSEYPTCEELTNFRREYEIIHGLSGDKIIKVYNINIHKNGLAIIMEDIKGKSLADILNENKLSLSDKLALAVSICDGLIQIHKNNIIHKDINPSNIIWNKDTNELRIIDFGISTVLYMEKTQNFSVLEGTLQYISPEQTGKLNRIVDYRSDFYSFGVTLYEIFTDKLPFIGDDLEIVYSHIAKIPKEPKSVNEEIPKAISDIIMKLLSKDTEDRYQNIWGLKYDLDYIYENFKDSRKMGSFKIAQRDISEKFQIPQKLYGREDVVDILTKTFGNLKSNGTKLLLISGYSGIGKTSVINEMHKIIMSKGGFFISGKFNQLERNNPYSAIIAAFRELIKNIIADYKNIGYWKYCLKNALGTNGKIMLDLIPELKEIIGEQPEVPPLNPVEEKNRFQTVFRDFIKAFAQKNYPLVIFLDDLQWSDFSTIDFSNYILTSIEVQDLLIIGAYRDNEVSEGHPLLLMMEEVKSVYKSDKFLNHIVLEPLDEHAINQMISDTLKCKYKDTVLLSREIYRKTKGNPFFVNKLLFSLYHKGIFKFNEDKLHWEWDLEEIEKVEVSSNVVDFLIEQLNALPEVALEVIKKASCIGNCFDLRTLYLISDEIRNIPYGLWILIHQDFIMPVDNKYKLINTPKDEFLKSGIEIKFCFSHDRIQQSAYSLISQKDKEYIHHRIGKILFNTYVAKNNLEGNIFEVINHLNIGKDLNKTKGERLELSNLNYKSGIKAKTNSAYDIANNYFDFGINLLSSKEWSEYPQRFFTLSYELAETCFLAGKPEDAFNMCNDLFEVATNIREKALVHALKAKILDFKGEKREVVIAEIRKALQLFEVYMPEDFSEIDRKLEESIVKIQKYFEKHRIENLIELPKMTDQNKKMIMSLIFQVQAATFQSYPPLNFLNQLTMFDMALTYGTTEVSCKNYAECGMILGSVLGNYEMGYKLNKVAFALIEKYEAKYLEAGCYFIFGTFISHWRAHYSECLDYFDLSVKKGMETGDMEHASYSCAHKVYVNLYVGMNLDKCSVEAQNAINFLKDSKVTLLVLLVEVLQYAMDQLMSGYSHERESLIFNEVNSFNDMVSLFTFGLSNLMINYLLGDIKSAKKWNAFLAPYLPGGTGLYQIPDYYMFQSLLLVKQYESVPQGEKEEIINCIKENLEKLKKWSDNSPLNYEHKYFIVSGELARILKEPLEKIIHMYKQALDSIQLGQFVNMKALVNELIGEFWLERDEEFIGKGYIKEAYYFYKLWGASSKVKIMEGKYERLLSDNGRTNWESPQLFKKISSSKSTDSVSLDIASILKSTQAISREIKLEKLLRVFMDTIVESACAQFGCLILNGDSKDILLVEAVKNVEEEAQILKSVPLNECRNICHEIVQLVAITRESIILDNAINNPNYQNNKYICMKSVKSVLCMPIIHKNDLIGIIYFENNLMENVFNPERIEVLKIILSQIAISIENAHLYERLEEKVRERTNQLEIAVNELKELSLRDPLTKLYNRRYLYEFISDMSKKFVNSKAQLLYKEGKRDLSIENNIIGVFLVDIDFFKSVNDSYGHGAGDKVLIEIANALKCVLREDDYIIRWGGEEFLIVLNKTKPQYLKNFSKKVLDIIRQTPIEIDREKVIYKTCSIGCVYLPFDLSLPDLLNLEHAINMCDFAMYKAKERGRNRAVHITTQQSVNYSYEEVKKYILDSKEGSYIDKFFTIEEVI